MRFCFLTTFYPPAAFGGDAIQVQRLAHAVADRGHEVTVVHAPAAHAALRGQPLPVDSHPGVTVEALDTRAGRLEPVAVYLSGRPLAGRGPLEAILARGFDVIHFHNPSLLGGPAMLALGDAIKLYTAHEQWLVCPTHVLWKYRRRVCERPQCWRCTLTYRRPPQLWRSAGLLDRSVEHLDALIVPSATSAALHERFAAHTRIVQLGHFVPDPGEPAPAADEGPSGGGGGDPYFLYAGRLESIKGVEALIDAWRRRPPDAPERLLIAGTGTLERSLRPRAAGLPRVEFLGWVAPERLDRLYRDALAVVVPTRGHESFGLVAVEAMARATPVLLHDFGALGELIADTGAGLAYASDAELDASLARLAGEADLRRELGERGRAAYRERWTPERHLDRYLGLIAELARGRPGAAPAGAAA